MNSGQRDMIRVTLIGAVLDLFLGIAKILFGLLGGSQALVADGVHSLSDLVTDVVVLYAARYGTREADSDHPYGHERIQTVATVFIGAMLIAVALGIAWQPVVRLLAGTDFPVPGKVTLVIALLAILSKECIYHYTMRVARRLRSSMLKANAWHSRTDALSSVVVLVGLLGAMAGLTYLDAVAAVVVAAMIVHVGWKLGWESIHELIDTGLDKVRLDSLGRALEEIEGVRGVHRLRTRRMGSQVLVDVHVMVSPEISVSEGHRLSKEAERVLQGEIGEPTDITVHIDVEDDEDEEDAPPESLPLRSDLVPGIRRLWLTITGVPAGKIQLHYLSRKVDLELHIGGDHGLDKHELREAITRFREACRQDPVIGDIKVMQELG